MLPIPVKPNGLTLLLQGCDNNLTNTLVAGFPDGFRISSIIPSEPPKHEIHRSIRYTIDIVQQKLNKEKAKRMIVGLFVSYPFPNIVYSPLKLEPKKKNKVNSGLFMTSASPKPTRLALNFFLNLVRLLSKYLIIVLNNLGPCAKEPISP